MEDSKIIDMYLKRDELAIKETQEKYSDFCYQIAYRILNNCDDAKECENDTYLRVWNSIPPQKPNVFSSFLGMIVRGLSLDRWRKNHAQKRGGCEFSLSLSELEECIPDRKSVYDEIETKELSLIISTFLHSLPEIESNVFLQRYWHFYSIKEISNHYGFTQSKVKMMLLRTRNKLYELLTKEGVFE